MKMYRSNIRLGNTDKMLIAINYEKEITESKEVEVDRLHHIHVLDRSYSMSNSLNGLIENVKSTLEVMSDNDLISVIWFSGEGQCKTIVKGRLKRDSEDIKVLLDTLKSPVGMTCFSESLQAVDEIIDDLNVICPNFSVTFFTDGEPVVSNHEKELDSINTLMLKLKDRIMALNAIGYGNYYNKELLQKMTGYTNFGRLIHSNEIDDYSDIFTHNYEILSDMVVEKVDVTTSDDANILYLTNKNSKMYNGEMNLDFLNKTKNQFFFIFDTKDFNDETSITVNNEVVKVNTIKRKVSQPTLLNFYYTMAYELYYIGKAEESLDILAHNLHDKALIDSHINAFTAEERQEHLDKLNAVIFSNKLRLADGESEEGYIPKEDAFCTMDLLKLLTKGNNYFTPLDSKEYQRIGSKVVDGFNLFKKNKDEVILAPMNELVFNAKHLNISLRYMINGKVSINPLEAKKVGLEKEIDSHIYRMQTIIKDGNLNVDKLKVRIDRETYNTLAILNNDGVITLSNITDSVEAVYKNEESLEFSEIDVIFNLNNLPIINRMYSKTSTIENVLTTVKDIHIAKARQKVFKYYIDLLKTKSYNMKKTEQFVSYTAEQIRVLEIHGLNSKLDYTGIDLSKAESDEKDFYTSRLLEFTLKGWSSLPKVQDVIEGKKKNEPALAMMGAIQVSENLLNNPDLTDKEKLEALNSMLQSNKSDMMNKNIDMNIQKMAKVLTGGWWENLELDKKQNYTFTQDDTTLIIKNDMVKVFF